MQEEIKQVLTKILSEEGSPIHIESIDHDNSPLLVLLTLPFDKVAFASLNGAPQENYKEAFNKFRRMHAENASSWMHYDLTLVLCAKDKKNISDKFQGKTEGDTHFCRKFIVDFRNIEEQIRNLPFAPFSLSSTDFRYPVSAQTFLRNKNVDAHLAEFLAKPHQRSKEEIIRDYFSGRFGFQELKDIGWTEPTIKGHLQRPKTRLKKIDISNFRTYRWQEYDLDADLVILYGPNGFGKTSFFEAIDFLCTGSVARIDKQEPRRNKLRMDRTSSLRNLDADAASPTYVEATFDRGQSVTISRNLIDCTRATVDGQNQARRATLTKIIGPIDGTLDVRTDNLINLFRATHIHGQEFQNLTHKLWTGSSLDEKTVSSLLALQDYFETIKKTEGCLNYVKQQINANETQAIKISNEIQEHELEMKSLARSSKALKSPRELEKRNQQMLRKIGNLLHVEISEKQELNREAFALYGAEIRGKVGRLNELREVADSMEEQLPDYISASKMVIESSRELAERKKSFGELKRLLNKKKEKKITCQKNVEKFLSEENRLTTRTQNLRWAEDAIGSVDAISRNLPEVDNQQARTRKELKNVDFELKRIRSKVGEHDKRIIQLKECAKELDNRLVALKNTKADQLMTAIDTHSKLVKRKNKLIKAQNRITTGLDKKRQNYTKAAKAYERAKIQLQRAQETQSEEKTLLDGIKRHVHDEICPVCGTSHESKDNLLRKIEKSRGRKSKGIEKATVRIDLCQAISGTLEKEVDGMEDKILGYEQEINSNEQDLKSLKEQISSFEEQFPEVETTGGPQIFLDSTEAVRKSIEQETASANEELLTLLAKPHQAEEQLRILSEKKENLEDRAMNYKSEKEESENNLELIREEAVKRKVSLRLTSPELTTELKKEEKALKNTSKKLVDLKRTFDRLKEEFDETIKNMDVSQEMRSEIECQIANDKTLISEANEKLQKIGLGSDIVKITQVRLKRFGDKTSKEIVALNELQSRLEEHELVLDESQTSAALARIKIVKRNRQSELADIHAEVKKLNDAHRYFDQILKEVQSVKNKKLEDYIKAYDPLSSSIQKRLRSPYGFSDIHLEPAKGELKVQVKHLNQKYYSPDEYFSASQMNILALSLFLSASFTQTWSSFAPILLDDPVQHFDDLNAYSLIDLIRNLLLPTDDYESRPQIFLSTCDSQLFKLLDQRFSRFDGDCISYKLETIGPQGPEVTKKQISKRRNQYAAE